MDEHKVRAKFSAMRCMTTEYRTYQCDGVSEMKSVIKNFKLEQGKKEEEQIKS